MTWEKWALIGFMAFSALMTVSTIGKPRKPIEPGSAVVALLLDAALIACVVFA